MAFFNRQPSANRQPYHQSYGQPQVPRQHVPEDTLRTSELQIERKYFTVTLKENPRGRFLRITEDVGGRRSSIIIPASGLADFKKCVDDMLQAADEIQPGNYAPKAA
jgi:PurA ssDNA and RNA-binding protein